MTRRRKVAAAGALTAALVSAVGIVGAPSPASADPGDIAASVTYVGNDEVHVAMCLNAVDQLPANIVVDYQVFAGGSNLASGRIADEDPNAVVLMVRGCPRAYASFLVAGLQPATTYSIAVGVTITPKRVVDSNVSETTVETDPDRAARTDSVTLTATTTGVAGAPGGGGGGGDDDAPAGPGTTSGGAPTGPAAPGVPTPGPSTGAPVVPGGAESVVVIADPTAFTAEDLAALSPEEVASIAPESFGRLLPATFKALRPAQAASLTAAQTSRIRPARAAALKPATVAALSVAGVRALRPAAVKFLTPAAVGAMSVSQLRALAPRQVAALRPKQLAELSAGERALLRRVLNTR